MIEKPNRLLKPFAIGNLKLRNRLVMPPMCTNYANSDGFITKRQIAYYEERARGLVGLIIVEHTGILQHGKASRNMLLISKDAYIDGLKRLTDSVHRLGGKIAIQLNHAGRQTSSEITGSVPVAPSPIPNPYSTQTPKQLSKAEIRDIIDAFACAAVRAKEAGFDAIELHMAHGYLICQFLSPFSNHRRDEYGGSLENRFRFASEVLRTVRNQVGEEFPITCRISGDEFVEGGLTLDDTKQIARMLEEQGANAIHVSGANMASRYLFQPPYYVNEGIFLRLAEGIKSAIKIPVIAVGRIRSPLMAEEVLQRRKADLVSMGRALIADPHLLKKTTEGRLEDIIPCLSCNSCVKYLRERGFVKCTVNPRTGSECEIDFQKTNKPKKIWIIGAGPAGMKAAHIAGLKGHNVFLFEKDSSLGGKLNFASLPPFKEPYKEFKDHLERELKKLNTKIELNKTISPNDVLSGRPDVVIVATGASPLKPRLPGLEKIGTLTVEEAFSEYAKLGSRVVIVGGGGVGTELADYLSDRSKSVTIVEMLEDIGMDLIYHLQDCLKKRLAQKKVNILTKTEVIGFDTGTIVVRSEKRKYMITDFDSVIFATGYKPNDSLAKDLQGKVRELYTIGDSAMPRKMLEAVSEGDEIAMRI